MNQSEFRFIMDKREIDLWEKMLYRNSPQIKLDVYLNDHGHPKYVHDMYGATAIDEFRFSLINEILSKNSVDEIWRISSDAFAIPHKSTNCETFQMDFRGIIHTILKKTITISQQ